MKKDIFNINQKYDIIYADPPWKYNDKMKMTGIHGPIRGAESFYETMNLVDLKNLPIKQLANDNAILFMWVTMPFLNKAEEVMNAWGFKFKTCGFTWVKKTKNGRNHMGMGHYTRGNAELCLIGIKGKGIPIINHSVSQIIESEIRKHSQKPKEIREKIVQLCGERSRIELFARDSVQGWDCWGNEAPNE